MAVFSSEVHHLLTEAGWFSGRAVSTVSYQQAALKRQLSWLPAAATFLSEFGGLHCYFTRLDHSVAGMQFEVSIAANLLDMNRLRTEFEPQVPGRALAVVGQAYIDPLCLLMDGRGTFYGACAEGLYHIADTVPDALEAIMLDKPFRLL